MWATHRFPRTCCALWDVCRINYSALKGLNNSLIPILSPRRWWLIPTCDIWGLKLICLRSTDPGDRLCNIWHNSTPSRSAWAKSKTTAEGQTTRWFGGKTLQSMSHRAHCLHSSIVMRLRNPSAFFFYKAVWLKGHCPRLWRVHEMLPQSKLEEFWIQV